MASRLGAFGYVVRPLGQVTIPSILPTELGPSHLRE